MNQVVQHIDWLGIGLSITAYFLMAKRRRLAISILVGSNLIWGSWAFSKGVHSLFFLNICYLILNIRTLYTWRKTALEERTWPTDSAITSTL